MNDATNEGTGRGMGACDHESDPKTDRISRPGDLAPAAFAGEVSPSSKVISSCAVDYGTPGGHDRVRVWNRGGLAGELVLTAGDADAVVELLGEHMCKGRAHAIKALEEAANDLDTAAARLSHATEDGAPIAEGLAEVRDVIVSLCDASIVAARAARKVALEIGGST